MAKKKLEWLALAAIAIIAAAALAIPLVGWMQQSQTPVLHARMAETGGWTPESLTAEVGKPLHLRLTSDDVMHSFAIGQSEQPPVDVKPGEITEVTLTFDHPGKYTYYCTRWCSINHWRMRGVIEVSDPGNTAAASAENPQQPLYVTLGLDIDAEHHAGEPLPIEKPSAARGADLGARLPVSVTSPEYYRSHSPAEAFHTLKTEPGIGELSDQEIWDLVAFAWKSNITQAGIENGRRLYATNCAACHGESGAGDGVFAKELAEPAAGEHEDMATGEMTQAPADFTESEHMLAASPAHLQGKIIRGGMGTGMPYWGPIFTEQETWDMVSYLFTFQFKLED